MFTILHEESFSNNDVLRLPQIQLVPEYQGQPLFLQVALHFLWRVSVGGATGHSVAIEGLWPGAIGVYQ